MAEHEVEEDEDTHEDDCDADELWGMNSADDTCG
jgi:hypothetical protein